MVSLSIKNNKTNEVIAQVIIVILLDMNFNNK